jgi:hypothetical protein
VRLAFPADSASRTDAERFPTVDGVAGDSRHARSPAVGWTAGDLGTVIWGMMTLPNGRENLGA